MQEVKGGAEARGTLLLVETMEGTKRRGKKRSLHQVRCMEPSGKV